MLWGVHSLKAGKSLGVDNVPSKPLKNEGEATTIVLTAILPEDLDKGMDEGVGAIACHIFTKER